MAQSQSLEVQEKKELVSKDEKTIPVRFFVPTTDIFETEDALTVVMEVPGVDKGAVDISVENGVLQVEAKIDPAKYEGMEPLSRIPRMKVQIRAALRQFWDSIQEVTGDRMGQRWRTRRVKL